MGKTAFVFAGQGAQAVGMCKDLYERSDAVRELIDMAEGKRPGIKALMWDGPKEQLDITINTQPAMFLADLACAKALGEQGAAAQGAAGFSLGEVPAACYAGLMEPAQAFDFVLCRAQAMQKCAEERAGTMFAVLKLTSGQVEEICSAICAKNAKLEGAYPVNYNCPGQTVVACAEAAAEQLQQAITDAGGKALKLAVSGAFHSPLMKGASDEIAAYLEDMQFGNTFATSKLRIPLYSNLTAAVYDDPATLLSKQVSNPVLWQKTIENMIADGFDTFIEVGPGKTLTGLIKKINADVRTFNVSDVDTLNKTVGEMRNV